jgi:hypothetical protein
MGHFYTNTKQKWKLMNNRNKNEYHWEYLVYLNHL